MHYPKYPSQPNSGTPLTMYQSGPSDARPSSGTAPRFAVPFDRRYGRRLAGTDLDVSDETSDQGYASNELDLLAEMDDIQDNVYFRDLTRTRHDPFVVLGHTNAFVGAFGVPTRAELGI